MNAFNKDNSTINFNTEDLLKNNTDEFIERTLKTDWAKPKRTLLQIQDHLCFAHCHEMTRETYNTYNQLQNLTVEEIMYAMGLEPLLNIEIESPNFQKINETPEKCENTKKQNAAYYLIKLFLVFRNFNTFKQYM